MTDTHGLTVQQADALWDAVAIPGPCTPTFPEQHERVCRTVARLLAERPIQTVQGRCPACRGASLFLGDGGHVTCARLDCPNPSAADELLHGEHIIATPRELALRQRRAWVAAGRCPMCGEQGTDGRLCADCTATVRTLPPRERRGWRRYEPPPTGTPIQGHGYTPAGLLGLDDTDPTEADIDQMMADGTPVQIAPSFKPGNVYAPKRSPRWEILFQREGTARFAPVRVDRDSHGLLHAYGQLSMDGEHRWTILGGFDAPAWKIVEESVRTTPNNSAASSDAAPDTITDPAYLHDQYAAVIRQWWDADDGGADEIADAVLRVRDRHVAQLRQRLALADHRHLAVDAWGNAYDRANKAEQQRDQLAVIVRDFLDSDPCQYGRRTYCQTHGSRLCPHARAREILAQLDEPKEPQ